MWLYIDVLNLLLIIIDIYFSRSPQIILVTQVGVNIGGRYPVSLLIISLILLLTFGSGSIYGGIGGAGSGKVP